MIIGLTGKSCSGKNYIASFLEKKGLEVLDLDRLAEKIRENKKNLIAEIFGTTDRYELAKKIFANPELRKKLEDIIYHEITKTVQSYTTDIVINGATIKRANLDKLCSFVIYVDAPYSVRLNRAISRDGISEQEFKLRNSNQEDIDPKKTDYNCPVYILKNNAGFSTKLLEKVLLNSGVTKKEVVSNLLK